MGEWGSGGVGEWGSGGVGSGGVGEWGSGGVGEWGSGGVGEWGSGGVGGGEWVVKMNRRCGESVHDLVKSRLGALASLADEGGVGGEENALRGDNCGGFGGHREELDGVLVVVAASNVVQVSSCILTINKIQNGCC